MHRFALILLLQIPISALACCQGRGPTIVLVWPAPAQQPAPKPQSSAEKANKDAALKRLIARAIEIKAEQDRQAEVMAQASLRSFVAGQKPVDPDKDEFRKWKELQRRREEDPDHYEVPRDDYKAWKETSERPEPREKKTEQQADVIQMIERKAIPPKKHSIQEE